MKKLEGKVALVTGGAAGIGAGIVERFSVEGARVVIADRDERAGTELARRLGGQGEVTFIGVDVVSAKSVEAMVSETVRRMGGLDVLVNNAGIVGPQVPLHEVTLEDWRAVMSVNLDGVFFGLKYGIAAMLSSGRGGVVVNMASIDGFVAHPNLASYVASKGGVVQLTRGAAIDYASHGIRVNALCPSAVDTPLSRSFVANSPDPVAMDQLVRNLNPMPGMVTIEDVAAATLFLASDESRSMTGVILPLDGGYTAR